MRLPLLALLLVHGAFSVSARLYAHCGSTSIKPLTSAYAYAGGFGGGSASTKTRGMPPTVSLSKQAKKLLKKHKNNVDAASTEYFQSKVDTFNDDKTNSAKKEMHEARVAATWDVVSMFLPLDYARTKGRVEPHVERRLKHIVTACRGHDKVELLDVGCGDGALVPFLGKDCRYEGIDISLEMIELAKRQWPTQQFSVGSFPRDVLATDKLYDTILFNGSLQFMKDTRQTLSDAVSLLKSNGRIVLSHVNGAKFVREECQSNPVVAVRNMPNNVSLRSMAELMGVQVVEKAALLQDDPSGNYDEAIDGDSDKFYLVALQKLD